MNSKTIYKTAATFLFFLILCINAAAQVAIGKIEAPDPSAILELYSPDKGLLMPRVRLTSLTAHLDGNQDSEQPAGLVIYNTGPDFMPGLYIWNGEEWRVFEASTAVNAEIEALLPGSVILEPSRLVMGEEFHGIMRVPYQGGNGGIYVGGATFLSTNNTGLTAKLKSGKLEFGTGYLSFEVDGIPAYTSPVGATFDITAINKSAQVTVGDQESANIITVATIGSMVAVTDQAQGFHRTLKTPDGRFSVRCFVPEGTNYHDANLQIATNIPGGTSIVWNSIFGWQGGILAASNDNLTLPVAGRWYGNGTDPNSDNSGTTLWVGDNKLAAWGNAKIYYNAPEQRRYMWMINDVNIADNSKVDKTIYVMDFTMAGPNANASSSNASKTKVYIQIQQIEANN